MRVVQIPLVNTAASPVGGARGEITTGEPHPISVDPTTAEREHLVYSVSLFRKVKRERVRERSPFVGAVDVSALFLVPLGVAAGKPLLQFFPLCLQSLSLTEHGLHLVPLVRLAAILTVVPGTHTHTAHRLQRTPPQN